MENKKNNGGLVVLIIVLCLLVFGLGGYIVHDKVLSNKSQINDDENIKDNNNYQINLINDKYKILNANNGNDIWYDDNYYLIKLNNNNNYDVVYNLGDHVHYIGVWNNRIYYSTSIYSSEESKVYIKYISLDNDNLVETTWLEIPQPKCLPSAIGCGANEFEDTIIADNTLYFNFGSYAGGQGEYDGLMSLNMSAKTFDEYKIIDKRAGLQGWCINKNNVYYFDGYYKLMEYNIASNSKKTLLDFGDETQFWYATCDNGKILYSSFVNGLNNSSITSHHELHLYDINSYNDVLITDKIKNYGGGLHSIANIFNGKVYYRIGNKIYLYNENNQSANVFYTSNGFMYQFFIINDTTMKIRYKGLKYQYVVNGKDVSEIESVNVKMEDGTIKKYTIDYLK